MRQNVSQRQYKRRRDCIECIGHAASIFQMVWETGWAYFLSGFGFEYYRYEFLVTSKIQDGGYANWQSEFILPYVLRKRCQILMKRAVDAKSANI